VDEPGSSIYIPVAVRTFTIGTVLGAIRWRLQTSTSIVWRLEAQIKGVKFEGRAQFVGRPLITVARGAQIVLGDGVGLWSSKSANPLGLSQPCALRALEPGARLVLGKNVGLSGVALCAGVSIEVGEGTIFGAGVMAFDNDFHKPAGDWAWNTDHKTGARPIKIGRGVFVGARAIILKGVTIGDRAVIGAGAVVTKNVPAGSVAAGNPARIVGQHREIE
jgi:acetyltransferase-like isoleucine patch superfamily enzyme